MLGRKARERRDAPGVPEYSGISIGQLADAFDFGAGDDGRVRASNVLGLTAYWRGVSLIAGTIAGLPIKGHRETAEGKKPADTFLTDPSPLFTRIEFYRLVLTDLLIHGNHFSRILFNGAGIPSGLDPIRPTDVTVKVENGRLTYEIHGKTREILAEDEVWHLRGLTTDGIVGLSPVAMCRTSLEIGRSAELAGSKLFKRGMMLGGIVSPKEAMTREQAESAQRDWETRASGVKNAHNTVVSSMAVTWQPLTMANEDAQWLESRMFSVEDVARILGVPPHLLMQTDKQTSWGSGVAEQNEGLARYTLRPWTDLIEASLDRLEPDIGHEFAYGALLRPSTTLRYQAYQMALSSGWMTIDEVRDLEDLPPHPITQALKEA